MTLRVGVDMIEVARIERAALRHGERFFSRFFTEKERELCQNQPRRLAARLAAKEAVAKAFGTGIGEIRWREIEVLHDERGRPILQFHGDAAVLAARMGLLTWEVSLSHTQDNAIAFVVALG